MDAPVVTLTSKQNDLQVLSTEDAADELRLIEQEVRSLALLDDGDYSGNVPSGINDQSTLLTDDLEDEDKLPENLMSAEELNGIEQALRQQDWFVQKEAQNKDDFYRRLDIVVQKLKEQGWSDDKLKGVVDVYEKLFNQGKIVLTQWQTQAN